MSGSTINQTVVSLKLFFEMNDGGRHIVEKITKIMPRVRKTGSDRAPTIQKIRHMMESVDTRIKCIILTCASSGIRVGAFEGMRWGDVTPVADADGKDVRAARVVAYRGSAEQYVTFVTPECCEMLLRYRAMREDAGERVTDASPLMRDAWDSHPYRKTEEKKDPAVATPLASKTISNMVGKFLKKINIRDKRRADAVGHEFKQIHGFRKCFKTNAERTMKTIDVEKMMGHAENYYKPSEEYLLEQYAAAVPNLTISEEAELRSAIERQAAISDRKVGRSSGRTRIYTSALQSLRAAMRRCGRYLRTSCSQRPGAARARVTIEAARDVSSSPPPPLPPGFGRVLPDGASARPAVFIRRYKQRRAYHVMKHRVSISVSSDEIALIRSKLASVGVQLADLRMALGVQQARVRDALLGLGDERDGARSGS